MAIKISNSTVIDNDKSFNIGTFTTATRPGSPVTGMIIYNSDIAGFESYNGSSWSTLGGSLSQIETVYTTGELLHTLTNPNAYSTSTNDYFGDLTSISGNRAIVSAGLEDAASGENSGVAYIFDVNTGEILHTLTNPNVYSTSANDNFGSHVSISDNYAIVGAYFEDDASGDRSGAAYVFDANTGELLHTLTNPNVYGTGFRDHFGASVAISKNYALIGAATLLEAEDDAGGTNSGAAYIFNITTGVLLHTLTNPNAYSTSARDYFGWSVDISDNHAIVGANSEDPGGQSSSGVAYIFDVATGSLLHTLANPNAYSTGSTDNFGRAVSISGNRAIVGAYGEDDAGGSGSGAAYIFDVTSGSLLHTLTNPNAYGTSASDQFGGRVAISDSIALVGAVDWIFGGAEDDAGGVDSGAAYIFDVNTGSLLHTLTNPNAYSTSAGDRFGTSVSISGSRVIVGASQEDDAGGSNSGVAYIFAAANIAKLKHIESIEFANGLTLSMNDPILQPAHVGGELLHTITNPMVFSTGYNDRFGYTVSISGNRAIVGAYGENGFDGASSGVACIFDVTTGSLLHTLTNPSTYGTGAGDLFGYSASISGNHAIVGAYAEDDAGGFTSGAAYIFNVTTGSLLHTLTNPSTYGTGAGDNFGYSASISGNHAIVGAYQEDDAGGFTSGAAYIFNVTTGSLLHTLTNPNAYGTSANDRFGYSVSISGNHAIVGAYQEDDAGGFTSGAAYIFDVTTGSLLHTLTNPNAYGTSDGDNFGYSVGISGNRAVVGAYLEDDAGGSQSGAAYIFDVTTGELLHTLTNPNAYSTSVGDGVAWSVSISGDHVMIGSYAEDDTGGGSSGAAYIFDVATGELLHTLTNPNAFSTSAGDNFGYSVSISGNHAIVGAQTEDDNSGLITGADMGAAYIFAVKDLTYLDKLYTFLQDPFVKPVDKIIIKNLLLWLDATNPDSYPGSGATWYSLNSSSVDVTLVNGVGFSSGKLIFDGLDDYGTGTVTGFNPNVGCTLEAIVRRPTTPAAWRTYFNIKPNSGSNTPFFEFRTSGATLDVQALYYNGTNYATSAYAINSTDFYHIVATYDGAGTISLYVNGNFISSNNAVPAFAIGSNPTITIGRAYDNTRPTNIEMGTCNVYSRALESWEIKQNFKVLRGRFGV